MNVLIDFSFLCVILFSFNKVILTLLSVVVVGINLYFVTETVSTSLPPHWAIYTGFAILGLLYLMLVAYLSLHLIVAFGGPYLAVTIKFR